MAHPTFHLVIASVGESRYDGEALSATIPTTGGEITILSKHEPLVATLKPGKITVRKEGEGSEHYEVEGGVVECAGNRVVVLL